MHLVGFCYKNNVKSSPSELYKLCKRSLGIIFGTVNMLRMHWALGRLQRGEVAQGSRK